MKRMFILLLILPLGSFAQEFKTTKAKEAAEAYRAENQRLETLKEKATAKYEKDLVAAREAAMKAGNLKEALAINQELEKIDSLKAVEIDKSLLDKSDGDNKKGEGKKGKQNILLDEHKGRAAAGINENNTYKFEVEPKGNTYFLKITFAREQKSKYEIFLTNPSQKIISIGKQEPNNDKTVKIDISNHIKSKGTHSFTLNYTEGCCEIHMDKMELIAE